VRRAALFVALLALSVRADQGALFERVAEVLQRRYYDPEFRRDRLPKLIEDFRGRAHDAKTPGEERAVIFELLSKCPTSHLTLLSEYGGRYAQNELAGRDTPTLGFQLARLAGATFHVQRVLHGGPAQEAGLLRGDRVIAIDGIPTGRSPRLDWRSDDAHLPDTPKHLVRAEGPVRLRIERRPGETLDMKIAASPWSALRADRASMRIIERGGLRLGYLHLSYMYDRAASGLLVEAMQGPLRGCDGLVLDLRGRGGSPRAVTRVTQALCGEDPAYAGPLVVLLDRDTRSAKEALAWELRERGRATLVGEKTAGAVRPGRFVAIGEGAVLFLPVATRYAYTRALELKGVEPDIKAEAPLPYAAGADPILEAGLRTLLTLIPF
jgi:carboxyl-terminal processing protease